MNTGEIPRDRVVNSSVVGWLAILAGLTATASMSLAAATEAVVSSTSAAKIEGVASLPGEATLSGGSIFEATLEDVSRADAPAEVLGKVELPASSLPIHFEIPFDPSVVAPERTYSVRARIFVDGRLAWTSDRVHRVLTRGAGHSVEMTLKEVPRREPSGHGKSDGDAAMPAHGLRLPATFRGDLPCADCEGVRHHLDLWPDQVFHLRREWLGKNQVRGEVGRWRVDPARRALILEGGGEMPLQFEIKGPARLRQLDLMGKPIASELPYELASDGQLRPADISLFMAGEVTLLADSLRFTECLTGRSYPVAPGGEAQRLEREYVAKRREPGAPLYVSLEGSIKQLPGMEQGRVEPTVTVERFVAAWPNQSCSRSKADAPLVNTYWRIAQLQGEATTVVAGRREPHIVLKRTAEASSYAATVGCNQLVGGFEASGTTLSFNAAASTRMACPPPLAAMERRLQETLERVRRWQRKGNTLVLEDQQGKALALLEAVYF